jgi:hypothetical protein
LILLRFHIVLEHLPRLNRLGGKQAQNRNLDFTGEVFNLACGGDTRQRVSKNALLTGFDLRVFTESSG